MSSISAVAGGTSWAAQVNQAATHAAKHVDRDGDHDSNKPDTAVESAKDIGAPPGKLNIKA
jgi:hypothetical protein